VSYIICEDASVSIVFATELNGLFSSFFILKYHSHSKEKDMQAFFDTLTSIVGFINDNILWGIPMILIILGAGIFMTVRTRALQLRKFGVSVSSTIVPTIKEIVHGKKHVHNQKEKSISQFEAFSSAIAGTVGTGNIVGVAGAMLSGGPGAVFWMWVSAFFGLVTNYSENVLGLYYRKKDAEGNFSGGPMYYIENGLGWKPLAKVFALCCTLAAVGMGMVQVNSISGTVQTAITSDPDKRMMIAWIVGIVVFVITALIVIGGASTVSIFLAPQIVAIFQKAPDVIAVGTPALRNYAIGMIFMAFSVPVNMLYQSIQKPTISSILSLIRSGMVTIPILLFAVPFLGLLGIQIAQPAADLIAGLISIPFIIHFLRKEA
jgi:amino acid transporter